MCGAFTLNGLFYQQDTWEKKSLPLFLKSHHTDLHVAQFDLACANMVRFSMRGVVIRK